MPHLGHLLDLEEGGGVWLGTLGWVQGGRTRGEGLGEVQGGLGGSVTDGGVGTTTRFTIAV